MENIVVASDISVRSERALARAADVALRRNVGLIVAHVIDEATPPDIAAKAEAEARAALGRVIASQPGAARLKVDIHMTTGDVAAEIVRLFANVEADLLVVGLHRRRAALDVVRETTVERLVRAGATPILLVSDAADHDYASVLVAVDMSPACARAVQTTRVIAPEAALTAFHAFDIPLTGSPVAADAGARMLSYVDQAKEAVDAWAVGVAPPADVPPVEIIQASPAVALSQMVERDKPDLLAIGAHSRATLSPWALGGFAASLVRDPPCDVLIAL